MVMLAAMALASVLGLAAVDRARERPDRPSGAERHCLFRPSWHLVLTVVLVGASVVVPPGANVATLLLLASALVCALALLGLLRERQWGCPDQHVSEAVFLGSVAAVATWLAWVERPWLAGGIPTGPAILHVVTAGVAVAGLVLGCRLAMAARRQMWWAPLCGAGLSLAAILRLSVLQVSATPVLEGAISLTAVATVGVIAIGVSRPGLERPRTSAAVEQARMGIGRLLLAFAAVLLVPAVTVTRLMSGAEISVGALAATTAVLSLAAVHHLGGLARDWGNLERRALSDELTGLPNRRRFTERVAVAVAEAARTEAQPAVLFCDLDRFKLVNDSLGHEAGNRLLVAVADRLAAVVPEGALAARLGGDEFAILLDDADRDTALAVATSVLDQLSQPVVMLGRTVHVDASIGVSRYPDDGLDPAELLRAADTAMYKAKDLGSNRVVVHSESLRREVEGRFALEWEMRQALDAKQFRIVYQPRVDLHHGGIVGAEALLRWDHPTLGAVPPSRFIPIAEESGLIGRLGSHVLRVVCHQLREWELRGLGPVVVSVNLSARQFELDRIADLVAAILRETGADPTWLELELTESLAHHDIDAVSSTLADLREMGVRCSIDDFGTGYSGLSYLGRFPLHALKIDKAFVQAIDAPRDHATVGDPSSVVSAVLTLGRSFGLRVIGEGVETPAQLRFLLDNGCDELQGHLFSEPLDIEAFEALLEVESAADGHGRIALLLTSPPLYANSGQLEVL